MSESHPCYVYLIEEAGSGVYCKIGYSKHPRRRLKDLQSTNPRKLKLTLMVAVDPKEVTRIEKALHAKFKRLRVSGEWFYKSSDISKHFASEILACLAEFQKEKQVRTHREQAKDQTKIVDFAFAASLERRNRQKHSNPQSHDLSQRQNYR